ncbi:hypothetical protein GRX03_01390 [Halovenus sp. WSH3]|uniref:Uncharacterized protein n=1 Tax=Halovenus carboxidivorans TaxID=2692199 RepID=A0A6B0SXK6_9EURY|nr:hypothetical protein [Halovenus carboxidivorans]MXR50264.1 hypothetical protein [Halovenus carboxidivorans]
MRRRALLTSLAAATAAVAGCQSTNDDPSGAAEPGSGQTSPPVEEPGERTAVIDLETGPRTYALSTTSWHTDDNGRVALWFAQTATPDHPPVVRGLFENRNDFENTFDTQLIAALGDGRGDHPDRTDAHLRLAPTERNDLAEDVPELERGDDGYWRVTDAGGWMTDRVRLAAGERRGLEFALVGGADVTGRPTGRYEFRGSPDSLRVAVWHTAEPGPVVDSRFAGREPPALEDERTVQWYHEADPTTPAFVRPSAERLELDGRLSVEMVNHSDGTLTCGHWNLYKLVDGQWFHVDPFVHTSDCRSLPPGGRKEWSLRAFNGEAVPCNCGGGLTRGHLGGGEYAVVAGYGSPTDASAALIELVGEPVTLAPTEDVQVERDGDTVTVTAPPYGDEELPPDATYVLTRAETAERRLVPEQVMRSGDFTGDWYAIRNMLAPVAPDVERVRLRSDGSALALRDGPRRFRFRGQAYEIRQV